MEIDRTHEPFADNCFSPGRRQAAGAKLAQCNKRFPKHKGNHGESRRRSKQAPDAESRMTIGPSSFSTAAALPAAMVRWLINAVKRLCTFGAASEFAEHKNPAKLLFP